MWDYDHMGWMMNGWGMGFGFILWLLILAVIIAGIVWSVQSRFEVVSVTSRLLMCSRNVTRRAKSSATSTCKRNAISVAERRAVGSRAEFNQLLL